MTDERGRCDIEVHGGGTMRYCVKHHVWEWAKEVPSDCALSRSCPGPLPSEAPKQ